MSVNWVFDADSGEMVPIEGLSAAVAERFDNPQNYGPLDSFDGHARITGPCGDTMEFWIRVADHRLPGSASPQPAAGHHAPPAAWPRRLSSTSRFARAVSLSRPIFWKPWVACPRTPNTAPVGREHLEGRHSRLPQPQYATEPYHAQIRRLRTLHLGRLLIQRVATQ